MEADDRLMERSQRGNLGAFEALVRRYEGPLYAFFSRLTGDADRLLIEALTGKGVVATPLAKYRWHNIRICRPFKIDPADLDRVIDSVIADLGKEYDNRNFLELTLLLLCPVRFGPMKTWTIQTCLGNCTEHQVICSGMIAQAFQRVGYPILPVVDVGDPHDEKLLEATPYAYPLTMRHYTQILPRDFDLSPNFQIIKFNIIEEGPFDYKHLTWKAVTSDDARNQSEPAIALVPQEAGGR